MNSNLVETEKKLKKYICRCNEVTEDDVLKAIDDGARTMQGIKVRTEAMMGLCQGRTCRRLIERMLAKHIDISKINISIRPPVRAILISHIAKNTDCIKGHTSIKDELISPVVTRKRESDK